MSRLKTLVSEAESKPSEAKLNNGCHHHWLIDVANGEVSKGVCKFCGAQQDFANWVINYGYRNRS